MDFKQFYKTINFDIDNEIRTVFQATQGDTKSRGLLVDLIVGGVKTPVTTEKMTFYALKPDGTRVMTAGVKDGTGFRIDFTNQTFAVPGDLLCTLVLSGTNGEKIADKKFKMTVDSSLEDGAIISEDERGILDRAFELANGIVPHLEDIETRFQALTAEQQQDAEVIDARDGEVSLGANIRQVKSDWAETEKKINMRSFLKYGPIILSRFSHLEHSIDFDLWRDPIDGMVKHNFKIDETGYEVRYISQYGSSSNNGKTKETAWGNLLTAISSCENDSSLTKVKLIFFGRNSRSNTTFTGSVTKKYIITSENAIGANQRIDDFQTHSGNVVKGGCPYAVNGVVFTGKKEANGLPMRLKKVNSLSDCLLIPFSYYGDGTNVYIHNKDTNPDNTLVIINDKLFQFTLSSPEAEVIVRDMTLLQGNGSQGFYFESDSGTKGKLVGSNIDYVNFGGGATANGVSTNGIKDTKLFNVRVFDIVRDGFNYHNTKEVGGKGTVFEYNCYAENTGVGSTEYNNNISTAHEGIHIVRVGTKGRKSKGPLIADVNGCNSVNFDVEVYDTSISSLSTQNAAFWFDDSPNTQMPNPDGKAWLINCAGGNGREWGINTDDSFKKSNKVFVDNFRGSNIKEDVVLTEFYQ